MLPSPKEDKSMESYVEKWKWNDKGNEPENKTQDSIKIQCPSQTSENLLDRLYKFNLL